ncbi:MULTISPECIES: methyltransferase domain-containing protein [Paenibacillus]|uniref:methyltransferase domain-containing protein n=1 Tax=Paenibacillus TaxID=44249 RepID=UPI00117D13DF|nr:methyltransferase domain-containing protein [Paenibacillus odorifer]
MDIQQEKSNLLLLKEIDGFQNVEENIQLLINRVKIDNVPLSEIFTMISEKIENKIDITNMLAVGFFNCGIYENVIPTLQLALDYDPLQTDTLINLSEILDIFGETELALQYIRKIINPSKEVREIEARLASLYKPKKSISEDIVTLEQNDVFFTGERLVINQHVKENYNSIMEEHLQRYELACKYVNNKLVLDAACGAGYGSKMLQQAGATHVTGVDIDNESLENARKVYAENNISYMYGDVNKLNMGDRSVDVIVSFETIEHIDSGANWIKESARILKDEGIFLVSTPNRKITNPGTYYVEQPLNPHHRFEYGVSEFVGELLKEYDLIEIYGQNFTNDNMNYYSKIMREVRQLNINNLSYPNSIPHGSALMPLGEIKDAEPMYLVAVCRKKKK